VNPEKYFENLLGSVKQLYEIGEKARSRGLDPEMHVEIPPAEDLAARVEGLVGPEHVAERIRELEKDLDRYETALKIIDEIIEGKFGSFPSREELAYQCIRTSLAILTESVTAASTEGIAGVKIRKNPDGSEYISLMAAGPIRSAGGTAAGLSAMLADYTAKRMGLQNYRPTESEIERYVEEINIYHNSIARLQYKPSDDEVRYIVKNCPICVDGDPTSMLEVSVYKNLPRIDTNRIRGGMCLIIGEGIAQKAAKLLKLSKKYGFGWDWLEGLVKAPKKSADEDKSKPIDKYLSDIVGGRPIFAYPSTVGGFRLRYGKARNNGIMAKCVHPATMEILDEFPVIGTQLKIERPGKGTALSVCDSIEGPVVRLKTGDVIAVNSLDMAKRLKEDIEEILFLGDMLVTYGDFRKSNHSLLPSGNCEEWWEQELEAKGIKLKDKITAKKAVDLSKKYGVPLHPKYTYIYEALSKEELIDLVRYLKEMEAEEMEGLEGLRIKRLVGPLKKEKRLLEKICIPHKVRNNMVIIEEADAILETLCGEKSEKISEIAESCDSSIELVKQISNVPIIAKAPTFIGARMGRPEKAKPRLMSPPPHVLFPIANHGGKVRDITKAIDRGKISVEMLNTYCPKCNKPIVGYKCPDCGSRAVIKHICPQCGEETEAFCKRCRVPAVPYSRKIIDIGEEFERIKEHLKEEIPDTIKGVIGTVNRDKYYEALGKGVLRAKHSVYVFKDGTIRFDATDMPLTHFKPSEVHLSIEKLKEIGYTHDYKGNELKDENQIIELAVQDVIIPISAAEYLLKASKFVDDLLEKFYGLPRYYNCEKIEDLAGHLIIGLAPHISVGVLGRIAGFTKARVCYAHPYWHTAKRRNSDGDEDTIMLALDAFLNFSKRYLPSSRGGSMDAPLVLTTKLNPVEVDDEVFEMELVNKYPLDFYYATLKRMSPYDIKIEIVKDRLETEKQYSGFGFTHDCKSIEEGPTVTMYTQLKTMTEKVEKELKLAKKITAVDEKDVAMRVLNFHFLRDIYGNLRAFGQQTFRCVKCNTKYRRVPLVGKCTKCGGKLLLTVNKGGIEKYLRLSQEMAKEYGLGDYVEQRLKLVEKDIESIFPKEKTTQQTLASYI